MWLPSRRPHPHLLGSGWTRSPSLTHHLWCQRQRPSLRWIRGKEGIIISPGGVRSVSLRHDLETFKKRLKTPEAKVAQEGIIFTENQLAALEKAKQEKEAYGEIETEHPGYLGAQDTHYVGTIKGMGRIYQQTCGDALRHRHLQPGGHRQAL